MSDVDGETVMLEKETFLEKKCCKVLFLFFSILHISSSTTGILGSVVRKLNFAAYISRQKLVSLFAEPTAKD